MKLLLLVGILILGFTIQGTVVAKLSIFGFKPDLLLALVVYLGLLRGPILASIAGFVVGFVIDLSTVHLLGINSLSKSVTGFAAGNIWGNVNRESFLAQFLALFCLSLLHDLIFFILSHGGRILPALKLLLWLGVPSGLYTSLVSSILFWGFMKLARKNLKFA